MLINASRIAAASLRSVTANVAVKRTSIAAAQSLHTSAVLRKGPTNSEEAVKAEKHDHSIEELQKKTANEAKSEFDAGGSGASASQTHSEEAAKADMHSHDPLPDHKKKSKSN